MRQVSRFDAAIHSHLWNSQRVHMNPSRWSGCLLVVAASRSSAFQSPRFALPSASIRPSWHTSSRLLGSFALEDKSDEDIENETMQWVRSVVVGWNLCPFAERPMRSGSLYLNTVRGTDEETILGAVLGEMLIRKESPGTTLVIAPECYPNDFEKYLEFVNALEVDLMEEYELHGHVQVAPFHPLFEFEGSGDEAIDNYTNRSPYPIFHVLREQEVETAVDKLGGDASRVWKRNVALLEDMKETLGTDGVKEAIAGKVGLKQEVDEVLKRHRFKVGEKE